ncbi:DNA-directed RNA polymerase II core subunit [Puccinia graminis f. sp. tritici]|uniref:DNA-directed RNA polymerase II core subunit n=1 Tax=Puccinia graminis f. sp. tritici TaxID=56615 RepID=A0A5B0Q5M4_PUCGR|nr:DNA-directed RNA polymerase II core subunit [Puccinia graminis f. sp. tritici]
MNAPNRYELYTLGEGESKLLIDEDTKIPNACTVTVNKEDHTLANMLRSQLLQFPYVIFAGYKVPHPLEPRFIIKVQTDGSHTPIQAIQEAVKTLILTLDKMRNLLQNEFRLAKTVGVGEMMLDSSGVGAGNLDDGLGPLNGSHPNPSLSGNALSGFGSSSSAHQGGYGTSNGLDYSAGGSGYNF